MVDETDKYITYEDAMWAACKALCHPGVRCPDNCCIEVRKVFNAIPAADVRPVVWGRWIKCGDNQPISCDDVYCCSNCKENKRFEWQLKPFCENCGADMREVQDG